MARASAEEPCFKVNPRLGYAAVLPTKPAYTFGIKVDRTPRDPGPGPGAYDPQLPWSRKGGGFGSSCRGIGLGNGNPSPQEYNVGSADLRRSAKYTFGVRSVPDHLKSRTPGPGAYDHCGEGKDKTRPSVPAISISHRTGITSHERKPGPNEYNPDYRVKQQMGVSLKFRHERFYPSETPAPHDYADKDFVSIYAPKGCTRKGYTFGVRHKEYTTDYVPGPHYQVGCSTLGAAAAKPVCKNQLSLSVVL